MGGIDDVLGGAIGAATKLFGAQQDRDFQREQFTKNAQLQEAFARNGIQWKVEDAMKAGVSPLFALGASTTSYAPQSVGGGGYADSWSGAGQDVSRALHAAMSSDERGRSTASAALAERPALENELLRAQIARIKAGTGPGLPKGDNKTDPADHDDAHPVGDEPASTEKKSHLRFGTKWLPNPWGTDAQDVENRSGDPGDTIQGIHNEVLDAIFTAGMHGVFGPSIKARFQRADERRKGGRPVGSFWSDFSNNEFQWMKRQLGF